MSLDSTDVRKAERGTGGAVIGAYAGALLLGLAAAIGTWLWLPAIGGEWSLIVRIVMSIFLGYVGSQFGTLVGALGGGVIGIIFG